MRKGLGKGFGQGYKNLAPMDSHIHSLSAKGMKTLCPCKTFKKITSLNGKSVQVWSCPCGYGGTKGEMTQHMKSCQTYKKWKARDDAFKKKMGLDAKAMRTQSWYRPYFLEDGSQVKDIKYYDEKGVVINVGHGWLEDKDNRDIESIDVPDKLPLKRKEDFSLKDGFVMSYKKEWHEKDKGKMVTLYLPFKKEEWVETEEHRDWNPSYVAVMNVMTNKKSGAVIRKMVDEIPKKKNAKFIEESKKLATLLGEDSPNEYSIDREQPKIREQIKKMAKDMETGLYAKYSDFKGWKLDKSRNPYRGFRYEKGSYAVGTQKIKGKYNFFVQKLSGGFPTAKVDFGYVTSKEQAMQLSRRIMKDVDSGKVPF